MDTATDFFVGGEGNADRAVGSSGLERSSLAAVMIMETPALSSAPKGVSPEAVMMLWPFFWPGKDCRLG